MEWWLSLLLILGSVLVLMAIGLPVAFSFVLVNVIAVFLWWGGETGLRLLILSIGSSVSNFALVAVPLFILMGEVMFRSGVAPRLIDALDKWIGHLPGRLSLLAVGGGALFATLSGVSMGSCAMLGSVLLPEMEKRGYKKSMTLGPILGSAGLAVMIPPSALAVILGAIGRISVGGILIAIIVPGCLLAIIFAIYIVVRCKLQPDLAPVYKVPPTPLSEKVSAFARYVLPLGFIIFLVTGLIFLGVATPTEAAAVGAAVSFILAACYGQLNWKVVRESIMAAFHISAMLLLIMSGAKAFSQLLAFAGATKGIVTLFAGLSVTPIFILISMQVVLLIMGSFMDAVAIMMIALPIFMPIVHALGWPPVWFAVIVLLNIEMATTSPPYGLTLFVMKGIAPPEITMGDIYRAIIPFLLLDLVVMILMIAFPMLALWLPGMMR